ncbi:hypothetical protein CEE69_04475 [Rhodopirellula bahusiensis]|uniref:Uncharacterized protein n=1 Tax=Rhodopirellula bahusiensis TaxID=2014065 RepID=A0A2G1WC59_9BACT|nr:hypothetical protein CEE69_04475 [Rhodopirellula bahusiensis]
MAIELPIQPAASRWRSVRRCCPWTTHIGCADESMKYIQLKAADVAFPLIAKLVGELAASRTD